MIGLVAPASIRRPSVSLINSLPSPTTNNNSPYVSITKIHPIIILKFLVVPFILYCVLIRAINFLSLVELMCVHHRLSTTHSRYYCLDKDTGRVYIVRHAKSDETHFPSFHTPPIALPAPSHSPPWLQLVSGVHAQSASPSGMSQSFSPTMQHHISYLQLCPPLLPNTNGFSFPNGHITTFIKA